MAITGSSIANTDSPNVTPFPDRLNTQQNRQNYHHDHDNNNNIACARAREAIQQAADEIIHGDIAQAYSDSLGRPMPKFVAREVRGMFERGISGSLIVAVLEYTAAAPQPSWAYARAVILRSWARGVCTDDDFLEALEARR